MILKPKLRLLAGAGLMAFAATSAHAQDASGGQTSGPGAQPIPPQDMPIQAGPGGTTPQARVRPSPKTTAPVDRKRVVMGKRGTVRGEPGGGSPIQIKKH